MINMNLKRKFIETFLPNLTAKDCREIYFHQYMWHAFSFGKVSALEGQDAIEEFSKYKENDVYILFQHNEEVYEEKNINFDKLINIVNKKINLKDCYVVDKDFKWTFVLTHETIIENPKQLEEDIIFDDEENLQNFGNKYYIGPFFKKIN